MDCCTINASWLSMRWCPTSCSWWPFFLPLPLRHWVGVIVLLLKSNVFVLVCSGGQSQLQIRLIKMSLSTCLCRNIHSKPSSSCPKKPFQSCCTGPGSPVSPASSWSHCLVQTLWGPCLFFLNVTSVVTQNLAWFYITVLLWFSPDITITLEIDQLSSSYEELQTNYNNLSNSYCQSQGTENLEQETITSEKKKHFKSC